MKFLSDYYSNATYTRMCLKMYGIYTAKQIANYQNNLPSKYKNIAMYIKQFHVKNYI